MSCQWPPKDTCHRRQHWGFEPGRGVLAPGEGPPGDGGWAARSGPSRAQGFSRFSWWILGAALSWGRFEAISGCLGFSG
eukprot:3726672-Pyramimonas_sp.AAC.1